MLGTLAEYERELITERLNAGIAAAKVEDTRFGRDYLSILRSLTANSPSSPRREPKAAVPKTPRAWSAGRRGPGRRRS
ncbi:recombinase family protein [Corynebacterium sp. CNJ-954]|uniref:recombinase family protein n=1 Tax=Corynebacterium sp. CNJ-954 TaxID=1904962 RepID=UPI002101B398|nr:recombinase family protein [Corynebacterium sp. CNJ-954]